MEVIQARMPIRHLKREIPVYLALTLSKKFDMYRVINSASLDLARNFAYVEHMLRPTALDTERNVCLTCLPASLKTRFVSGALEDIDCSLLETLESPPILIRVYEVEQGELQKSYRLVSHEPVMPLSHILVFDNKHFVLYTPTTSFIDGFDPKTAIQTHIKLPNVLIKKARATLYVNPDKKYRKTRGDFSPYDQSAIPRGFAVFSPADFMNLGDPEEFKVDPASDDESDHASAISRRSSFLEQGLKELPRELTSCEERRCCTEKCYIF